MFGKYYFIGPFNLALPKKLADARTRPPSISSPVLERGEFESRSKHGVRGPRIGLSPQNVAEQQESQDLQGDESQTSQCSGDKRGLSHAQFPSR